MSDARSILADFVRRRAIPCPTDDGPDAIYFDNGHAREALAAIEAAGYHILSDAELQARDDAVLERAAEVPGTFHQLPDDDEEPGDDTWWARKAANGRLSRVAAAIRAMQGGKPT